ncbi:MAG: GspE/PulE family protein, partial [Syntrophales bacterium]
INLNGYPVEPHSLRLLTEAFTRTNKVVPLFEKDNRLTVAIANPFDIMTIGEIERLTSLMVDVKVATETDIMNTIERFYGGKSEAKGLLREDLFQESKPREETEDLAVLAPVVQLVNQIIIQAVNEGVTDIHIEPKEKELRSRFRIDGILHDGPTFPKNLQAAITTRLKIMANLNISESRLPQDGRIVFPVDKKHIDLRVSTLPNIFGENIVLRVLDKEKLVLGLSQLGFSPSNLTVFRDSILKSNGIILVCGPTGSGKTTTLYSALSYLNSREKNIVTLEDPVEYELPELCQSQINLKQGFTFAGGLRAILRQDPDIIFVGEMRDAETIEVAIRAAITGHLVFSTLHTNDAAGAIARLLDMGVEPYLLSSSLVAIIGQRLVRCICPACKEEMKPGEDLLGMVAVKERGRLFYSGKGCSRCYGTGYSGRIGIFEVLPVSSFMASLIAKGADGQALKDRAKEEGMATMMDDGLQKAGAGVTTLEEVVRVAYGS